MWFFGQIVRPHFLKPSSLYGRRNTLAGELAVKPKYRGATVAVEVRGLAVESRPVVALAGESFQKRSSSLHG